jgi:hypothetical protein
MGAAASIAFFAERSKIALSGGLRYATPLALSISRSNLHSLPKMNR